MNIKIGKGGSGKITIGKENVTKLKSGSFHNQEESTYIFRSATNNTLAQIFNPTQFGAYTDSLTLYDINFNQIGSFFTDGSSWLYDDFTTIADNYVLPANTILAFGTTIDFDIIVGGGAIIQKYYNSGKTNQTKYIDLLFSNTLRNQLVAFWNLDDASNSDPVASNYGSYSLNLVNGFTSITGKINQGVEFFDYYNEEYEETFYQGLWTNQQLWNLLTNPTSFSVSFWHKIPDNTQPPFSVMGNAFGSMGFHFDYYNFGHSYNGSSDLNWVPGSYGISFRMSGPGGPYKWNTVYANEATPNNTWTMVTATYDLPTTTMKLYLNGVLKSTYSNAIIGSNSVPSWHGFALNGTVVNGGKEYGTNQCFDALGFWSRALDQSEISNLYNNGNGKQSKDVAANLTFLFDPIFYKSEIQNERYKISVQGCSLSYVNGIYSQTVNPSLVNNRPYFIKDDDSNMYIEFDGTYWSINDGTERDYANPLFYKADVCNLSSCRPNNLNWSTVDGGDAYYGGETPPTMSEYLSLQYKGGGDLDPVFLEQIRNYQINNIIPNQGLKPLTIQHIPNATFNTRKVAIKNNMLSYLKDPNDNDVEDKNFRKNYGSITSVSYFGINTPQDNKKHFLILTKNDNTTLYTSNNSTLNFFIRLQRPVSHKNPNTGYIVREKRGTFLTSYAGMHKHISFGYRSPYYNINGDNTYKLKFEPFSFVFSFGYTYSSFFGKPINYTVMTDYKLKFGEVYLISIQINSDSEITIFINGEIQNIALLPFNPLINRTRKMSGINATYYAERINQSPLAPGFIKKDGTIYSPVDSSVAGCPNYSYNYLIFGKSKLNSQSSQSAYSRILKRKRFLNNLDIGVINSYNIALSQTEILQIYNNFRFRYL